jgi:hypothetical protein
MMVRVMWSGEWRERIAGAWEVLRGRAWAKPFQEPVIVTKKGMLAEVGVQGKIVG